MIHFPRRARAALPALAAAAALAAVAAPAASADYPPRRLAQRAVRRPVVHRHRDQRLSMSPRRGRRKAGAYVLEVRVYHAEAADFSANCTEFGTYYTFWLVTCPAQNVKRLTFDGKLAHDSFINNTSLPSWRTAGRASTPSRAAAASTPSTAATTTTRWTATEATTRSRAAPASTASAAAPGATSPAGRMPRRASSRRSTASPTTASHGETENVPGDIEGLQGGRYADKLSGNSGANVLRGGDGSDDLDGGAGDDLLNGQAGDDTLHTGAGDDFLYGGTDSDSLSYAAVAQLGLRLPGRAVQRRQARDGERQRARHREADRVAVRRRPRGHAGR